MAIEDLIDCIDRYTNNGAIYPNEPGDEGIKIEEGVALIRSFSNRDWFTLRSLNIKEKSAFWVECLITLLDRAYLEEARQIIIHIALTGTENDFFTAMECIRDFRRYVSIYEWLKLKNRAAEIQKSRESH